MKNLDIVYERDIHKSYMKIFSGMEEYYDERLILTRKLEGFLSVEKCFVNGEGQFLYDISGKHDLDSYCKINEIGKELFEQLLLQICARLEFLEWNLIEPRCLVLQPEQIFMEPRKMEFLFVLYPAKEKDIFLELQSLMEYILTKLNHKDAEAVQIVYQVYERILEGTYSIEDLRDLILQNRMKNLDVEIQVVERPMEQEVLTEKKEMWTEKLSGSRLIEEKLSALYQKVIANLQDKVSKNFLIKRKEITEIIYPEEKIEEEREIMAHPTVCLSTLDICPKGVLLYEGIENYRDFELGQLLCVIGKSPRVKLQIEKETISQFHAKIEWIDGDYYMEDMNSTNGTYINDEILNYKERKVLHSGDVIRFADVKYRFI